MPGTPIETSATRAHTLRITLWTALLAFTGLPLAVADTLVVDGVCTLADAIRSANTDSAVGACPPGDGPDVIVLDVDVTLTTAETVDSTDVHGAFAGLPDVVTDIEVRAGLGQTIQRAEATCVEEDPNDFRLFNVLAGSLTLNGVTVQHGCVYSDTVQALGGAIFVDDADLHLVEVVARNNAARSGGTAYAEGGAINVRGDGTPAFSASGSLFENNLAQAGRISGFTTAGRARGGAIKVHGFVEFIRDSIFVGNLSKGGDGFDGGNGDTGEGGALHIGGPGIGDLSRLIFRDNVAQGGSGTGSGSRAAGAEGGAAKIFVSGEVGLITDCLFENNRALSGTSEQVGGSIARGGGLLLSGDPVRLMQRSSFIGNVADSGTIANPGRIGYGGGLFLEGQVLRAENLTIVGNLVRGATSTGAGNQGAPGLGGGIYVFPGTPVTLAYSTIAGNRAISGSGPAGEQASHGGGVFMSAMATLTAESVILGDNTVETSAGSVTGEDCHIDDGSVISNGYNVVEAAGLCSFAELGDVAMDPGLLDLVTGPCNHFLPDGSCVTTQALDPASPAVDRAECPSAPEIFDGRGLARPIDVPGTPNLGGECDSGAFEVQLVDVGLTIDESQDPALPDGSSVLYTLTVANHGPSIATGIEVDLELTLPPGVSLGFPGGDRGTGGSALYIGRLDPGASYALHLALTVDTDAAPGIDVIEIAATLQMTDQLDAEPANNAAMESTSIADLLFADGFEAGNLAAWSSSEP